MWGAAVFGQLGGHSAGLDGASLSGLIPALSVLLGIAIGIHGLWQPHVSKGHEPASLRSTDGRRGGSSDR